jgi:hypothetical protein
MKFKDVKLNDVFVKQGQNEQFKKVAEQRVSCCKIKCNAKSITSQKDAVFRPLDEVTKIEK